ncbi:MAG: hypothetical protein M3Z02_10735 [Actinomycetota bacterium]|nr:hypothetical protein [Actinomycetota bacterium]
MIAFAGTAALRQARVAVIASPDSLLIRNVWRTRKLERSAIEGFRVGLSSRGFGKTIHVLTKGDTVYSLDMMSGLHLLPITRRRFEARLASLQAWLA